MRTHTYLHSTKRNGPSIHWSSKPGSLLTFGGMGRLSKAAPLTSMPTGNGASSVARQQVAIWRLWLGHETMMKQHLPYTSHVKMCKTFQKIIENLLPAPQQNITKPGFHVLRAVRRRGSHYRRACRSCTRDGRATGRRRGVGRSGRFRLSDLLMVGICWYKHV